MSDLWISMSYHGYPMVKSTFYTDRTSNPTPPSIGLESGAKLVERLLYGLNSKYDPFTIRISPERERERVETRVHKNISAQNVILVQ